MASSGTLNPMAGEVEEGELRGQKWQKMGTQNSFTSRATEYFDKLTRRVTGDLEGDDLLKVMWLSGTLFFIVGGYWLLRSLKDPIMSTINGVSLVSLIIREQ